MAFQQSFNACNLGNTALPCTSATLPPARTTCHSPAAAPSPQEFPARFSLAYRPFNDTKTVIRAGFGVFTMTNLGPLSLRNSDGDIRVTYLHQRLDC